MLVYNIPAVISFLLLRLSFSYKKCLDQRTYLTKDVWSTQLPGGIPLSRPLQPFCGPLAAIFNFASGSQFFIKGVLRSKNLFRKIVRSAQGTMMHPLFYFILFYFLLVFLLSKFIHQLSSFIMLRGRHTNRKQNY